MWIWRKVSSGETKTQEWNLTESEWLGSQIFQLLSLPRSPSRENNSYDHKMEEEWHERRDSITPSPPPRLTVSDSFRLSVLQKTTMDKIWSWNFKRKSTKVSVNICKTALQKPNRNEGLEYKYFILKNPQHFMAIWFSYINELF